MAEVTAAPHVSRWARFRRRRLAVACAGFLLLLVLVAVFAPLVARFDPNEGNLLDTLQGPNATHWLGTDRQGRDILARVIYGTRYALLAGVEAVAIAVVLGVPLGMLAGYYRGWADRIVMRVVEVITSLPAVVVAIAVIAATGPGLAKSMIAIGLIYAMLLTRLTRAQVLAAREEIYVDAARVVGAADGRIMVRHLLPNVVPPLIVQVTLMFAGAVLAESTLSFLGIGVPSPEPSWGVLLTDARDDMASNAFMPFPPGIAIFLTVFAFNQVGDGLRDVFAREARGGNLGVRPVAAVPDAAAARAAAAVPARPVDHGAGAAADALLSVQGLSVLFPGPGGEVPVVADVSFDVAPGEVLALVGESGCGKSVTALSIPALVPDPGRVVARSISFAGTELVGRSFEEMSAIRGRDIGFVFQEPSASLNPAFTVGWQLSRPLRRHLGMTRAQARTRAVELLARVGITDPQRRVDAYPHEFSGGMAQRVMIAMALACEPKLLIADEPTTALDVTVQGQVLDLLAELRTEMGMAVLLITHDLGVVADVADRAAVMYAGQIVETAALAELVHDPEHPYTAGLLAAVPRNEPRRGTRTSIPGTVPPPWQWPTGCRFAPRCAHAAEVCAAPVALGPADGAADGTSGTSCAAPGRTS